MFRSIPFRVLVTALIRCVQFTLTCVLAKLALKFVAEFCSCSQKVYHVVEPVHQGPIVFNYEAVSGASLKLRSVAFERWLAHVQKF